MRELFPKRYESHKTSCGIPAGLSAPPLRGQSLVQCQLSIAATKLSLGVASMGFADASRLLTLLFLSFKSRRHRRHTGIMLGPAEGVMLGPPAEGAMVILVLLADLADLAGR